MDVEGWPMNWKPGGVMSLTCAGVVFVGFCHVSESARMWMSWSWSKPVIAPGRFRAKRDRILSVPSAMFDGGPELRLKLPETGKNFNMAVVLDEEGPGLRLMSPDSTTRSVTTELK